MTIEIGQVLNDRYRIDESIGHGGMAEVFKVWDEHRAVYLALKLLRDDLAQDPIFLRRFKREAHNLSELQHPNIVRFYGLERDGLEAYMLMEFVNGNTLRANMMLRNGNLYSLEETVEIIGPVCSALYYAHRQGLVHCDIKPANIMLEKTGRVLLADFGIARLGEGATTTTMVGAGTPAYMAPEQILGRDPTPQSDIYSLGIVLYEMLTGGERPFTGEVAQTSGSTMEKVRWEQLHVQPSSMRKFNPKITPQLEAVVMKCLEKNPEKRYLSALELSSELAEMQSPEEKFQSRKAAAPPTVITPAIPTAQPAQSKPEKSKRALITMLTVAAIVIISAMVLIGQLSGKVSSLPIVTPTPTLGIGSFNISPTDGMKLLYIPAGDFQMGSDQFVEEQPNHTVTLDAYWIDETEVTNAMYEKCVKAGICSVPTFVESGARPSYYGNVEFANFPVILINWNQAKTYCTWAGRTLPTEAQWEKASRGADGRTYPWGEQTPDAKLANYLGSDTTEVGTYPDGKSPYGALDMAGNVWEFVLDWYAPYSTGTATNPNGPTTGTERGLRGGSFVYNQYDARTSSRGRVDPTQAYNNLGFRCAQNISQ